MRTRAPKTNAERLQTLKRDREEMIRHDMMAESLWQEKGYPVFYFTRDGEKVDVRDEDFHARRDDVLAEIDQEIADLEKQIDLDDAA